MTQLGGDWRQQVLLTDISLYLSPDEYQRHYGSEFAYRSRYLCNYVRRGLIALRYKTSGFGALAIRGCSVPGDGGVISVSKVAAVDVEFRQEEYDGLSDEETHEFFIGMLLDGMRRAAAVFDLPAEQVRAMVGSFRAGGYVNTWVVGRKSHREQGVVSFLRCSLDSRQFKLGLVVERKGMVLYEREIIETPPDEIHFAHILRGTVTIEKATISLADKFGDVRFEDRLIV